MPLSLHFVVFSSEGMWWESTLTPSSHKLITKSLSRCCRWGKQTSIVKGYFYNFYEHIKGTGIHYKTVHTIPVWLSTQQVSTPTFGGAYGISSSISSSTWPISCEIFLVAVLCSALARWLVSYSSSTWPLERIQTLYSWYDGISTIYYTRWWAKVRIGILSRSWKGSFAPSQYSGDSGIRDPLHPVG